MRIRNAVLTGLTGLMLNVGLAGAVSAQSVYVYRDESLARRYMVDNRWEARQIVRQAYLDILQREPDASGLRQYTNAMLRDGWSAADVRRSLANSDEYRERFGRASRYQRLRYYRYH